MSDRSCAIRRQLPEKTRISIDPMRRKPGDRTEALFTEVSPDLILQCADQVDAPLERVAHLYQVALELGVMRSPGWEDATSSVRRSKE